MIIFKEQEELKKHLAKLNNRIIGFVPTMGALHQGHISLIKSSNKSCNVTICSIYVNPTQFNNPDDFLNYPKTIKDDIKKHIDEMHANKNINTKQKSLEPSNVNQMGIKCQECNILFSLEVELKDHVKTDHENKHVPIKYCAANGEIQEIDKITNKPIVTIEERDYSLNVLKAVEKKITVYS